MDIIFPKHLHFSNTPTPIQPLKRLPGISENIKLWIKRDDFTGSELSGNKVRKLDFLFQDALQKDAGHVITCGGLQSNHCRATAFVAAKLGLATTLFLRGNVSQEKTGNYFLDLLSGAKIIYVTPDAYKDIDRIMASEAAAMADQGKKPYIIPEGGSNHIGVWGYIKCFGELLDQVNQKNLAVDTVVVATGSGGTHAGLLIGSKILKSEIGVVSINVCDSALFFKSKIASIIDSFNKTYDRDIHVNPDEIHIVDGFAGEGYGQANDQVRQIIIDMARYEGIVLDPVYSAKAFLGVLSLQKESAVASKNILFIHTGGLFGLFPMAAGFDL